MFHLCILALNQTLSSLESQAFWSKFNREYVLWQTEGLQ